MDERISREAAESLWADLREAFVNAEVTLVKIIEARAWEPLGYGSFPEAWAGRMGGVRLASEAVRCHVVYALLSEGQTDEQIVSTLGGQVGDQAISRLREQRDMGVPAGLATTRVRSHERSRPSPPETLHVRLTPAELADFKALADALGRDMRDEAAMAIRAHFRRLERADAAPA